MASSIYRPLNPERAEIRLLQLHPGSRDDALRGTLCHAFLDDNTPPVYETISYCWGDMSETAWITVNDSRLEVAKSTAAALRRIRHQAEPRLLWIDGVCINQKDVLEKNKQVPLMTEVYANSKCNLAILDGRPAMINEAVKAIRSVEADSRQDAHHVSRGLRTDSPTLRLFDSEEAVAALVELYTQPLFRWQWELVVAPITHVFYDDHELLFETLIDIAKFPGQLPQFVRQFQGTPSIERLQRAIIDTLALWQRFDTRYFSDPREQKTTLWHILGFTHECDTALLHDKIYSCLGLHRQLQNIQVLPVLLEPNCNSCLDIVFTNAFRYMLWESAGEALLYDTLPKSHPWRDTWPTVLGTPVVSKKRLYGKDWLAPRNVPCKCWNTLSLRGSQVDSISYTWPKLEWETILDAQEMLRWILAITSSDFLNHNSNQPALAATFIGGRSLDDVKATPEHISSLEALIDTLHDTSGILETKSHADFSRCNSSMFGLANEDANVDDEIVIFQGITRPFILRREGDLHTLVCESYVHGIMDGEAWKGEDDPAMKVFNII